MRIFRKPSVAAVLAAVIGVAARGIFPASAGGGPTLTVLGNRQTPAGAPPGAPAAVEFSVNADHFSEVAGQDFVIRLPDGAEIQTVSASSEPDVWQTVPRQNYAVSGNVLHITDLLNLNGLPQVERYTLRVTAQLPAKLGDYPVSAGGRFSDGSERDADVSIDTTNGTLTVGRVDRKMPLPSGLNSDLLADLDADERSIAFVPFGAAYWLRGDEICYLEKNGDGTFSVPSDAVGEIVVSRFKLPNAGVPLTTFGVARSTDTEKHALKFGNYIPKTEDGAVYGTVIVEGDYAGLEEWYIRSGHGERDDLLTRLVQTATDNGDAVKVTYAGGEQSVNVYHKTQEKYMWKSADGPGATLEYALQLNHVLDSEQYTAVGYSCQNGDYVFSETVKTGRYTDEA